MCARQSALIVEVRLLYTAAVETREWMEAHGAVLPARLCCTVQTNTHSDDIV